MRASAGGPAKTSSAKRAESEDASNLLREDDDEEEEATLMLRDSITGRELEVGVEGTVDVEGKEYLVVYPVLDAVTIAELRPDGVLEAVEEHDELLPAARAALEEEQLQLIESAYVLTVDDDDALDTEILDEDSEDDDDVEDQEILVDEDDENAVEVLAEFGHNGQGYVVARALAATVLIARQNADGSAFEALVGDELVRLAPQIDEQMARWPHVQANGSFE